MFSPSESQGVLGSTYSVAEKSQSGGMVVVLSSTGSDMETLVFNKLLEAEPEAVRSDSRNPMPKT